MNSIKKISLLTLTFIAGTGAPYAWCMEKQLPTHKKKNEILKYKIYTIFNTPLFRKKDKTISAVTDPTAWILGHGLGMNLIDDPKAIFMRTALTGLYANILWNETPWIGFSSWSRLNRTLLWLTVGRTLWNLHDCMTWNSECANISKAVSALSDPWYCLLAKNKSFDSRGGALVRTMLAGASTVILWKQTQLFGLDVSFSKWPRVNRTLFLLSALRTVWSLYDTLTWDRDEW